MSSGILLKNSTKVANASEETNFVIASLTDTINFPIFSDIDNNFSLHSSNCLTSKIQMIIYDKNDRKTIILRSMAPPTGIEPITNP